MDSKFILVSESMELPERLGAGVRKRQGLNIFLDFYGVGLLIEMQKTKLDRTG